MVSRSSGGDAPRRLRWSVPAADTSTMRWLRVQENVSRSLQLIIREVIQREGYVDVVNRPIEQLPRRGRPPASATGEPEDETDHDGRIGREETAADADEQADEFEPGDAFEPDPLFRGPQRSGAAGGSDAADHGTVDAGGNGGVRASRQHSIDEIMASTRR